MKNLLKFILFFVLFTAITMAATIPAVNMVLKNDGVRNSLLHKFATFLNGELEADALSIALDEKSVHISSRDLKGELLNNALIVNIPNLRIRITYIDLFQGSFFPKTFLATSPKVSYTPRSGATVFTSEKNNWSRELNTLLKNILGQNVQLDITDGTLVIASTTMSELFIRTNPDISSTALNLSTDIMYNESVMPLDISGTAKKTITGTFSFGFEVKAASIPLKLLPSSQDFYFSGGTADFTGKLSGNGQDINMAGSIKINNLDMTVGWSSEDKSIREEKAYRIARSTLAIQGGLQRRKIDFQTFYFKSDDFQLQGSFIINFDNIINPFMDLHMRSDEMTVATLKMLLPDPLINNWTTQTIFPRIENGTAIITDFKLTGTTDEIGRLSEPENANCLSWSGILHNVDTFYNDHKPLASIHSAKLSMDGDQLNIREVNGESGKSILSKGNLSISNLYGPTSILATDINGSFSLPWLTELAKAGLTGKYLKQLVSQVSSISGQVDGYAGLSFALKDKFSMQTLKGKGTATSFELALKHMNFPVTMKKADFTLAYPGTCIIKGKGSWGKSTFDGHLNLVELDKKQQFKLNIKPDLTELKKIFTDNRIIHSLAPCISTLPILADIILEDNAIITSGSLDFKESIPLDGRMECKQLLSENQLVNTDFTIDYSGNNIDVKQLSLYTRDGSMKVTGYFKKDQQPPYIIRNTHIQAINFPLHALNILIPDQEKQLHGLLTASIDADNLSLNNIWQTVNGTFELKGWQGSLTVPMVIVNNLDLAATMNNGQIELLGSNILLADFKTESPLKLQAELRKQDVWNGTVRLYGDYLDSTTIPSLFRKGKTDLPSTLPFGKINIIAGVDRVRYRNLIFSPFLMQCIVTADRIIFSNFLLQLDEDFLWLTGYQQDNEVIYKSSLKIREKPVDTLMAMMGFDDDIITGDLNMDGNFTAVVTPGETIFDSTTGPIYFEIKDGTLESSSTMIKILDLISLENIFDKQDILKWKNSFNYSQIDGKFDLLNGVLTTNSLIMDAPAFDLFAEGNIDLSHVTINMQIKLAPFCTINNLFSSIPFLGYVLTGKTKSMFDYTLSINGKIGSADVEYTPLVDTIESLTGYIKRLVTSRQMIKQEINVQQELEVAQKQLFIQRMDKELEPLHPTEQKTVPSE